MLRAVNRGEEAAARGRGGPPERRDGTRRIGDASWVGRRRTTVVATRRRRFGNVVARLQHEQGLADSHARQHEPQRVRRGKLHRASHSALRPLRRHGIIDLARAATFAGPRSREAQDNSILCLRTGGGE